MIRHWISLTSQTFWRIWLLFLTCALFIILASLFFIDQSWAVHFGSKEMQHVWLFHRKITEIGAAEVYIVLALISLLAPRFRRHGAYALACMLSSGLVLHILKFFVGRLRPHKTPEHDPFLFDFFNFHHHYQSFPSGHSQTLFSVATFIAYIFPKTTAWIFSLALYLAFTRAITLAHFVSDVWAGAALGLLVSVLALRYLVRRYGP